MRAHLRGKAVTTLEESSARQRCDCGWLRPKFVDIRQSDKVTPVSIGEEFYLLFDCPQCGARWDARYGKVS